MNLSVEAVCDRERLHALENEWRSLHSADEHSHVFTSWPWMSGRLAGLSTPWWVLVARAAADGPVIGLLALRQLPAPGAAQSLAMAGSPLADYTGFVCDSQFEQEVLTALAIYVQQRMVWQLLEIHDARDPRLRGFLAHFGAPRYRIERIEPTPCPYLELDDSWEDYLRARSTRMRKKIRRELRMMEALAGVRRTTLSDDAERQIEILLQLWQMRWGALPATRLAEYSAVFRACAAAGCLWLDVLWQGSAPIVALLAFLDRPQGSFCYYISGFDSRYAALSPGSVMVAHSIRAAIQGGYRGYDFLRGDEHYKLSFGARIRASDNVAVIKQGRSAATELDSVL